MAEQLRELRSLSDDEIIERHDAQAGAVGVATDHYLQELARRDQDRQTSLMLDYTKQMAKMTRAILWLTIVITILTVVNVAIAAALLRVPWLPPIAI